MTKEKKTAAKITHGRATTSKGHLYTAESGKRHHGCLVFLHGWPEDWTEWQAVLALAGRSYHAVAFDLPGIGKSDPASSGQKTDMADVIHEAVQQASYTNYIVVGHDIGAMVAYAYLRKFPQELSGAVLLGAAIPGVAPWQKVLQNPYIWHFAFHAAAELPEKLVGGNQRAYFDYFFDALTHDPSAISKTMRRRHASAYSSPAALHAGFEWYRAFSQDVKANEPGVKIDVPLLYLRGEFDQGDLSEYIDGLRATGMTDVTATRIPKSKHYIPEENPAGLWKEIETFAAKVIP